METLLYSKEFTVGMRVHPKRDRGLHAEDVPQRGRALLLEGHPAAHHGRDAQARMEVLHLRAVQGPLQVLQGPGKGLTILICEHSVHTELQKGLCRFIGFCFCSRSLDYYPGLNLPATFFQPGNDN